MTGLVAFLVLAFSMGIGHHAQTTGEIRKIDSEVPMAQRYTRGKLDYDIHEKYPPIKLTRVVQHYKEENLVWRELRSQVDEDGYWINPKAK